MNFTRPFRHSWKRLAPAFGWAGAYFALGWLGGFADATSSHIPAIWPATGVAIAGVWWGGYRVAPAIGLATFILSRLDGASVPASIGVAFADMIEPALAVWLMRHWIREERLFARVNHVVRFFLWAGLLPTVPSAALGSASLCWGGEEWEQFSGLFLLRWAGHLSGALTVAPVLLIRSGGPRWTARECLGASVAWVALTVVCVLVFAVKAMPFGMGFPAAFPVLPVIMWVAVRLGRRATASATLLVCVFAVGGTLRGMGPFMDLDKPRLGLLHLFLGVTTMTGLLLATSVTERNEAEAAARENEARKTAILETAFDAILPIDDTGRVQEWNPAAERMFGYRRTEATGQLMDELIVPSETRRNYPSGLADYLITGVGSLTGRPFETTARRRDGLEFPAELAVTRVPASKPPIYTVVVRDLTRRKQAESALRQSEERLRLMVEGVKDYAIYMLDPSGRVASWNVGAERLKGYREEEILGKAFPIFFTPEDIERGVPGKVLKMAEEHGHTVYEGWRVRKDGSRFWVQGIITALRDERGKLVGFSKLARDTTELRRAEEALRTSEAHFRTLVEQLPQMVWTCRADGTREYFSPQWTRYTGISEKELIQSGTLPQIHPDDRNSAAAAWQRSLAAHTPLDAEFRIRGKDGEYRWFRVRVVPLRNADGEIEKWLGAHTDIDDQKRAREVLEVRIRERTAQLQASLNSTEELLYTIAHDLRAPNRAMQGFAQLLQADHAQQLDDTARDYLNRINTAAVRNDQLIRDLLEHGRLSHEAAPLKPVDLRRPVEGVLRALDEAIRQRRARVQLGQDWPTVLAYEPWLRQILAHLLSNALLYVPAEREPEIVISAESDNGKAVLRVKDNGVGIPPDQINRAFRPFIRLPNSIKAPGTGMGLASVKKAIERMNGRVGAESQPGEGSCFWLELPTATAA